MEFPAASAAASAAAAAAGAAASASAAVYDLCEDDTGKTDTTPNSAAAATVVQTTITTIDLCQDDDDDNQTATAAEATAAEAAAAAAAVVATTTTSRRQQRKRNQAAATRCASNPFTDADTIAVVDGQGQAAATRDNAEAFYTSALGPVRMDFVAEWKLGRSGQNHAFGAKPPPPTKRTRTLYLQFLEYKLNLPICRSSSIFVRAQESRLDLLRALITGPEDTPYANGMFFFDLQLPDYPNKAPVVKFLTTGGGKVRFNPNLYNCGKVCLSLLGTWQGPGWESGKSTILQVLVSIQGLILGVSDPYFNEPGFTKGQKQHQVRSRQYNSQICRYTLQYGIAEPLAKAARTIRCCEGLAGGGSNSSSSTTQQQQQQYHDYPEFAEPVVRHFASKHVAVEQQLQEWVGRDPSLAAVANAIRTDLATVVSSHQSSTKVAAKKRKPETIDLNAKSPETIVLE